MEKDNFVKLKKADIYLSSTDIKILEKYGINYQDYTNMKELLFQIETILNTNYGESDLEELAIKLADYNYYFRTNK